MRKKRAIYNVISNLFLQLMIIIYGFIVPKIIISKYGSNVNGLVVSITQFLGYISLLQAGFGPVVKSILYKPLSKKDKIEIANILKASEKFFRNLAFIFILYIILLSFIYPIIVNGQFEFVFTLSLILIISISTFAEYYFGMTYSLLLQADQKNYIIAIIQIFTYLLSIISVLFISKLNCSIQILKLVTGIFFVIRPILLNIYVKKKYFLDLSIASDDYKIKNKWDGLAQHIAFVIHSNTDITLLSFFVNLSEVSVYSVYSLVIKGVKSIVQALSNGIDSTFGNMIANNEIDNLNKKFKIYEFIYHTIATIIFVSTMLLITPFVSVYTKKITDVDYIRPIFAIALTISEFIWAIRLPYNSLVLAAGHFKQTRNGAWFEAISNIVISLILIFKLGIIGVVIGTIVSMFIRTIEFMYYSSKYILKRKQIYAFRWMLIIGAESFIILALGFKFMNIMNVNCDNYFQWFMFAIFIFVIISIVVIPINIINNIYVLDYIKNKKLRKKVV